MANPTLTLDASDFAAEGFVNLTWTNATKGSNWYSWRLYRRPATADGKWTLVREYLFDAPTYEFNDYWCASNVPQEWVVVRVHLVAAVPTEEAIGGTVQAATPTSDNYWLIHPYNIGYNILLFQVTGDNFSLEVEAGEMNILNRGRRMDHGTVWGRRGSLSAQIRDKPGITAAEQRAVLEAQQRSKSFYWLRNPWGDMTRVRLSDLQVTRVPGVGLNEFVDVTMSYAELAA